MSYRSNSYPSIVGPAPKSSASPLASLTGNINAPSAAPTSIPSIATRVTRVASLGPSEVHPHHQILPPVYSLNSPVNGGIPSVSVTGVSTPAPPHPPTTTTINPPVSSANTPAASAPKGTQTVFIHKLYDMLNDPTIEHLIWWLPPKNDSFCLLPGEEFSKALAQYFKHTNIASFIRQLNMYGFHKVNDSFQEDNSLTPADQSPGGQPSASVSASASSTAPPLAPQSRSQLGSGPSRWEFRHSTNQFRKGDVESLKLIKRRSSKNVNSHKEIVNLKSIPTSNPGDEYLDYIDRHQPQTPQHSHQQHQQSHQPALGLLGHVQYFTGVPQGMPHMPPQGMPQGMSQGIGPPPPPPPPAPPAPQPQGLGLQHPGASVTPGPPPGSAQNAAAPPSVFYQLQEISNTLQTLRSDFASLSAKYDSVNQEMRKSNLDMVHLIEFIEKMPKSTPVQSTSVPVIDRSKMKTPVGHAGHALDLDSTTSPLSKGSGVGPAGAGPGPASGVSFEYELSKLKSSLLQRSSITLRNSSSANAQQNIVPQPYPLNPHYTIHHPHLKMDPHERHLSVLMDPLQVPVPSRHNLRSILLPLEQQQQQQGPLLTSFPPPTGLPCGSGGGGPPGQAAPDYTTPPAIRSYQQYPFPNTQEKAEKKTSTSAPGSFSGLSSTGEVPPRSVPKQSASFNLGSLAITEFSSERSTNQLPSVSELDQSLKVGNSPVYSLLNSDRPTIRKVRSDDEDMRFKRRRV